MNIVIVLVRRHHHRVYVWGEKQTKICCSEGGRAYELNENGVDEKEEETFLTYKFD